MNVLVYDNVLAYYELIASDFPDNFNFVLFSPESSVFTEVSYDAMIFFIHDELELIDFVKLYDKDIPVMFGIASKPGTRDIELEGNIYYLHLDKFKDEIIEEVGQVLEKLAILK